MMRVSEGRESWLSLPSESIFATFSGKDTKKKWKCNDKAEKSFDILSQMGKKTFGTEHTEKTEGTE